MITSEREHQKQSPLLRPKNTSEEPIATSSNPCLRLSGTLLEVTQRNHRKRSAFLYLIYQLVRDLHRAHH